MRAALRLDSCSIACLLRLLDPAPARLVANAHLGFNLLTALLTTTLTGSLSLDRRAQQQLKTSSEAQRVAQQIEQLTDTIRQMAEDAQRSAETARLTLLASQQGQLLRGGNAG